MRITEDLKQLWFKVLRECLTIAIQYDVAGTLMRKCRFIRAGAPQCVVLIDEHHNPSSQRNFCSLQPLRISTAVPPFMVVQGNLSSKFQEW